MAVTFEGVRFGFSSEYLCAGLSFPAVRGSARDSCTEKPIRGHPGFLEVCCSAAYSLCNSDSRAHRRMERLYSVGVIFVLCLKHLEKYWAES